MFKTQTVIEMKGSNEKLYRFVCDSDSPLGEVHDMLYAMKTEIVKQIQSHNEKEKPQEQKTLLEEECKLECQDSDNNDKESE